MSVIYCNITLYGKLEKHFPGLIRGMRVKYSPIYPQKGDFSLPSPGEGCPKGRKVLKRLL